MENYSDYVNNIDYAEFDNDLIKYAASTESNLLVKKLVANIVLKALGVDAKALDMCQDPVNSDVVDFHVAMPVKHVGEVVSIVHYTYDEIHDTMKNKMVSIEFDIIDSDED